MSKPCFALVALLAVIAFSEVQGIQKYIGHPWYLNGILPRGYGPASDVNQKYKPIRPVLPLWWKSYGFLPPRREPVAKPKPEQKPLLARWWIKNGILTRKSRPELKPKPEYKPQLPPWWMRTKVLTPGSKPEWKPKPEYKPQLPPWWMRTKVLTPGSKPEWKPKPEHKPQLPPWWMRTGVLTTGSKNLKWKPKPEYKPFPIQDNWLRKGRYHPKREPEWRPRIAINPQPRPEWSMWPGSYFPKGEPEWRPTPVYPPVYPVYPLPVTPRQPYPYSYSTYPLSGQPGFPYRPPPYVPMPSVHQYHIPPYGRFMKPSYPIKTAHPHNPMPKNPLFSTLVKRLLKLKAMRPSNTKINNATHSNASSPTTTANATISLRVELRHPNKTIIEDYLKLSKQPLKNILNILAKKNKCFNYTTFQRNSRITDGKVGEYVRKLCNTEEIYESILSSKYWLLYTESGVKDLDVAYIPKNNTCIKIEYMNSTRLSSLLNAKVSRTPITNLN